MKIILPFGEQNRLAKDFKVHRLTVGRALNGKRDTSQAKMLRAAALQRGGYIYESPKKAAGHLPDCETTFNTVDNTMVQTFSDRVVVVSDLTTGNVATYVDGRQVHLVDNVDVIEQLPVIVRQAELKAKELANN